MKIGEGRRLRLLSAMEVLEARREAAELSADAGEKALCANACLLARALERNGRALFQSGRETLEKLSVEEIAALSEMWRQFNRENNPSPGGKTEEITALKKAWSTRLRSAFAGACSTHSGRCRRKNGQGI